MKHLFYFFGLIYFMHELSGVFSPVARANRRRERNQVFKENKGKPFEDWTGEYKTAVGIGCLSMVILLWLLGGLFTSQWVGFAAILLLNFAVIWPLSKLVRSTPFYPPVIFADSLVSAILVLFIIINAYHLHIDLWSLLNS